MRITTYTTRMNEDSLNVLVKERTFNYKTENSHFDCTEKITKGNTSFGPCYYWKGRWERNILQHGRAWIVERMSKSGYSKLLARIWVKKRETWKIKPLNV